MHNRHIAFGYKCYNGAVLCIPAISERGGIFSRIDQTTFLILREADTVTQRSGEECACSGYVAEFLPTFISMVVVGLVVNHSGFLDDDSEEELGSISFTYLTGNGHSQLT